MTAIPRYQHGFRLVTGDSLNQLVDGVNNLSDNGTPGPVSGTTGAFSGNVTATGLGAMPTLPEGNVTALGGNLSTAAALSFQVNRVLGANDALGVAIPAGVPIGAAKPLVVINTVANKQLLLYPPAGGSLNGGSANTPITMGNGSSCWVFSDGNTSFRTVPTVPS